jgi:hypothetical protein
LPAHPGAARNAPVFFSTGALPDGSAIDNVWKNSDITIRRHKTGSTPGGMLVARMIWNALLGSVSIGVIAGAVHAQSLTVTPSETLETQGLTVIVDQNHFSPIFFDEKNAGIQMVLHGERIATDGAVRLDRTPEQWAPVPAFVGRTRGSEPNQLVVRSAYAQQKLSYSVKVTAEPGGFRIAVDLDQPLPASLAGKAGFNLDFLPTAYFGKTYLVDAAPGLFPRHPTGPMAKDGSGDPLPLGSATKTITLAPEDPLTRVSITSDTGPIDLYDARARAQNGWFVVRSLIATGAKENAVVWHVRPNVVKNWTRQPVVSFNQAGYTPGRPKVALIELDPNFKAPAEAELVRLTADGGKQSVLRAKVQSRGHWTRYDYAAFDFSSVREPGLYAISYAGQTTNPFRIAADAYQRIWQTSLDTFIAEQMDHVGIREQYRVWSAPSHLDDARQAPPNITHFDGYKMGPNLDSPFKAGQHIPGLAVGGWQDAGDYDIQTPENAAVTRDLVWARELFGLDWDETSIDEAARKVEIRKPDGVEDAVQQIRHGTLQLLAQYKVFGHAIVGIVDPALRQYAHLGDAGSQTDNRLYDAKLGAEEIKGGASGTPDACRGQPGARRERSEDGGGGARRRQGAVEQAAGGRGQGRRRARRFLVAALGRGGERRRHRRAAADQPRRSRLRRPAASVAAGDPAELPLARRCGGPRHSVHGGGLSRRPRAAGAGHEGEGGRRHDQQSVRRADRRRHMGGLQPGGQLRHDHVPVAQGLPGDRRHRLHAQRDRLRARAASGEQPVAGLDRRHRVEADRLRPQSRRL